MPQWRSSVSLGKIVERFNTDKTTLIELVLTIQEEFRRNPFYEHPDVRHAVEALADMHLPAKMRGAGLGEAEMCRAPHQFGGSWTSAGPRYARISTSASISEVEHRQEHAAYRKILGEVERRLQKLEKIGAKDNRIYTSRVLRHFELNT